MDTKYKPSDSRAACTSQGKCWTQSLQACGTLQKRFSIFLSRCVLEQDKEIHVVGVGVFMKRSWSERFENQLLCVANLGFSRDWEIPFLNFLLNSLKQKI